MSDADRLAIKAVDLEKDYGMGFAALRGLDLEVRYNEFVAVVGPSGCGKSTLLNLVGAMDRPTSGDLWVDGEYLNKLRNLDRFRTRSVGFIFQAFNLIPTLTALENVAVPMLESKLRASERKKRAMELLDRVGLTGLAHRVPAKLSGGERQRVAIARALANGPRILLADEPTGNLDSTTAGKILELLKNISSNEGMTLLLVTHDRDIASQSDRIVHLLDGKVISG